MKSKVEELSLSLKENSETYAKHRRQNSNFHTVWNHLHECEGLTFFYRINGRSGKICVMGSYFKVEWILDSFISLDRETPIFNMCWFNREATTFEYQTYETYKMLKWSFSINVFITLCICRRLLKIMQSRFYLIAPDLLPSVTNFKILISFLIFSYHCLP